MTEFNIDAWDDNQAALNRVNKYAGRYVAQLRHEAMEEYDENADANYDSYAELDAEADLITWAFLAPHLLAPSHAARYRAPFDAAAAAAAEAVTD